MLISIKINKEILLNIKEFNINYEFEQMVLKYLINNKISDIEKQMFKDSFYALDFNHNGFIIEITSSELTYFLPILNKALFKLSYSIAPVLFISK